MRHFDPNFEDRDLLWSRDFWAQADEEDVERALTLVHTLETTYYVPNKNGEPVKGPTPLMIAAEYSNNPETIKILINAMIAETEQGFLNDF